MSTGTYNSILLELFTWTEVSEYLKTSKAIIVPIGSVEQHGPTGAIGTDAFTAEAIAREVGIRTNTLVAPTQPFGMAEHHLGFPGTMSLQPRTLILVIHDLLISLISNGFERIYLVNGHGGNIATTKAAFMEVYKSVSLRKISWASKVRCKISSWFNVPEVFTETKRLYGDKEGQHATPSEISITLKLHPDLIEKQNKLPEASPSGPIFGPEDFRIRYPDGRMGSDPYLADPEHGQLLLDKAATALTKDFLKFLQSP